MDKSKFSDHCSIKILKTIKKHFIIWLSVASVIWLDKIMIMMLRSASS